MKYEWRKQEKELYLPKEVPSLINVPKQKFLVIKGKGDPNEKDFSERVGLLYAVSYAIRMMPKNGYTPDGYFEYTVYPLEGVWDLTEEGRQADAFEKKDLVYTIMIRQPDFVDEVVVGKALEATMRKKTNPLLKELAFVEQEDGLCVQMLHIGSFDDEPVSFGKMTAYLAENQLVRRELTHKEIYLSDPQKVDKAKLKTVLRFFVK